MHAETKKTDLKEFLKNENVFITYLLEAFEVPETVESDSDDYDVSVKTSKKKAKLTLMKQFNQKQETEDTEEISEVLKQKFDQRKICKASNKSNRKLQKQKKKNILKNKSLIKAGFMKQQELVRVKKEEPSSENQKKSSVFNNEGKLFFSKIKIDGEKAQRDGDTHPRLNLGKLVAHKKKVAELIESGKKEEAKEEKEKNLWSAAFKKTQGIKVKDNPDILKKVIKKRKMKKVKSKSNWSEREKKMKEKQAARQKKRQDNLDKRKTDNLKTKKAKQQKRGT